MNKNGFTLVELIVSIVLVSIVLVSMTGTLVKLKQTYNIVNEDADARIYGATISKIINDDFLKNNGIRDISCSNDEDMSSCEIVLGTNQKRTLEILRNTIPNDKETIYENGKNIGTKTYEKTTLRYSDSTTGAVKTLLIKTIELIVKSNNEVDNNLVNTYGYKFTDLSVKTYKYKNIDDYDITDKITHIIIGLSNEKYNIDLYSSGTYKNQ